MLILDTDGNVFSGFTPLEWESPWFDGKCKCDDSLKSFISTLKDPHNIPVRKFASMAEKKQNAIHCNSSLGPAFGYTGLCVSDDCNAGPGSWTPLGHTYTNDTGLDKNIVFTGSKNFRVKEIEVFEIAD
jgi:hypothetical protein